MYSLEACSVLGGRTSSPGFRGHSKAEQGVLQVGEELGHNEHAVIGAWDDP